jgi:DNA-binding XRE family transcriptional regulator
MPSTDGEGKGRMSYAGNSHAAHEAISAAIAAGTNALRAFRESIHYSVEDLAVACGLTRSEIDDIENGTLTDDAKLRRIASALRLPEDIFSG